MTSSESKIPTRVLIIGPSNIGDALLMCEVVAAIHRAYPQAHRTLVVGERATALFREDPRVDSLVDLGLFDSPLGRLRLALALWRYQPHVVVDLRHTLYPVLLKPARVLRYLRRPPGPVRHMRERHLWTLRTQVPELVALLEATSAGQGEALWLSPRDTAHVEHLWRRWQLDGSRRIVVISPGARSHIKRWMPEGFARLADRLIREANAHVVFSGEPDEEPIVDEIVGLMEARAHSAVGSTTIRQLGALMRRSQLVITNDSAALHLASLLGVPTLALFGPTDEARYGPTARRSRVIRRRLFCAPCERALCRFNHECMRFISADDVYRAAVELLEQRA